MLYTNKLLSLTENNKNNLKCQKRCLGFFGCRCNQINLLVLSLHQNAETTTTCKTVQLQFKRIITLPQTSSRSQKWSKVYCSDLSSSQFKAVMQTACKYNAASGSSHHMSGNFHTPFWDGPPAMNSCTMYSTVSIQVIKDSNENTYSYLWRHSVSRLTKM